MKALVFNNYQDKFNLINQYLKIEQVEFQIIKFKNGEGKIVINGDIENEDIIIFSDFSNHLTYNYLNKKRKYSSDEYYVELKRLISACDKTKSISVFLPLIYESRQNSNNVNESKDYLVFIKDLKALGVTNIITFEVHGDENEVKSFSYAPLFKDKQYDVVVSLDKGGKNRAKEYSKLLNCDLVIFNKVRDLKKLIDGYNPIKEYIKQDYDFKNKKVLIVDDILDSGSTLINGLKQINQASLVDIFICYPLFSKGSREIEKLFKQNKFRKIYVSDLIKINNKIRKNKFIEVLKDNEYLSEIIKKVIR